MAEKALLGLPVPLAISPDGQRVLVQSQTERGYGLGIRDRAGATIREIETKARPRLTTWSPSGEFVSYAADQGGGEYQMHLWNVIDGEQRALDAALTQIVTQPKWSGDGARLTHVVERKKGQRDLQWIAKDVGAKARPLLRDISAKAGLAWDPSGKRIATVKRSSPGAITFVQLDAKEVTIPLRNAAEIRDLSWSPDGKRLLLTSRARGDEFFSLSELELDTHESRRLRAAIEGDVVQPFYLPERQGLVYRVYPGDEKLVYSCTLAGEACVQRGPQTGQVTPWASSVAGDKLYLGQLTPRNVYEVELASGAQSVVYAGESADFESGGKRVDVRSKDGLAIPVHVRPGAPIANRAPAAFIQVLGAFGKESPAPWDAKAQFLHAAGITVLKVYVRGKAGFGRALLEAPGGTKAQIEDVLAVIRYAAEELRIPRQRIVLFGHSDGALLAARVAATGVELGKLVVSSMLEVNEPAPPARLVRCADAFQGAEDRLPPARVPEVLRGILGPSATTPPCGSITALPGEAHEIERADSWAQIFGPIAYSLGADGQPDAGKTTGGNDASAR